MGFALSVIGEKSLTSDIHRWEDKEMYMTIGSLFDGIGGFPLSAQRHGITPIWASEIDANCISITRRHFPEMVHLGDIMKINGAEIIPVDIISGGSPCTDLSTAGKREGLAGSQSGLFFQMIRVIREMLLATENEYPRFIVFENVPGLLSSNGGDDFKIVMHELQNIGNGFVLDPNILDAHDFGLAQRRRRVFVVAINTNMIEKWDEYDFDAGYPNVNSAGQFMLNFDNGGSDYIQRLRACRRAIEQRFRRQCAGKILTKRQGLSGDTEQGKTTGTKLARNVTASSGEKGSTAMTASGFSGKSAATAGLGYQNEMSPTLTAGQEKHVFVYPDVARTLIARQDGSPCIDRGPNFVCDCRGIGNNRHIAGTLTGDHQNRVSDYTQIVYSYKSYGEYKLSETSKTILASDDITTGDLVTSVDCRNYVENYELSATLQASGHGGPLNSINPVRMGELIRRLTPTECERLQGLPDGWTATGHDGKLISDSARYRAIGNGVAINCVDYIMRGIVEIIQGERK